jgi:hypothetical protein
MTETDVLTALVPVIALLFLGVAAGIGSRTMGISPIVGYLVLGLGLRASGLGMRFEESTVAVLAQLGVIFLLFEDGLHFSLEHLRKCASHAWCSVNSEYPVPRSRPGQENTTHPTGRPRSWPLLQRSFAAQSAPRPQRATRFSRFVLMPFDTCNGLSPRNIPPMGEAEVEIRG